MKQRIHSLPEQVEVTPRAKAYTEAGICDYCADGQMPTANHIGCRVCPHNTAGVNGNCDIHCTDKQRVNDRDQPTACVQAEDHVAFAVSFIGMIGGISAVLGLFRNQIQKYCTCSFIEDCLRRCLQRRGHRQYEMILRHKCAHCRIQLNPKLAVRTRLAREHTNLDID